MYPHPVGVRSTQLIANITIIFAVNKGLSAFMLKRWILADVPESEAKLHFGAERAEGPEGEIQ